MKKKHPTVLENLHTYPLDFWCSWLWNLHQERQKHTK